MSACLKGLISGEGLDDLPPSPNRDTRWIPCLKSGPVACWAAPNGCRERTEPRPGEGAVFVRELCLGLGHTSWTNRLCVNPAEHTHKYAQARVSTLHLPGEARVLACKHELICQCEMARILKGRTCLDRHPRQQNRRSLPWSPLILY